MSLDARQAGIAVEEAGRSATQTVGVLPEPALLRRSGAGGMLHRLTPALLCLSIMALAALPRLTSIDRSLTADEPVWFERASRFGAALAAGDWGGTELARHPGVTTLWLGALGMGLARAQSLDGARLDRLAPSREQAFVNA